MIIALWGQREHIVIVTPVKQPALQLSKQKQKLPSLDWGRREYIRLVKVQSQLSSGLNVTWYLNIPLTYCSHFSKKPLNNLDHFHH